MRASSPLIVPQVLAWALLVAGCPALVDADPGVAAEGEACDADYPCAGGLQCSDGRCVAGGSSSGGSSGASGGSSSGGSSGASGGVDGGEPACGVRLQCAVDGRVDGRDCVDGRCTWLPCEDDAPCGARFCLEGFCADVTACTDDEQCADQSGVCEEGRCVAACMGDAECNTGALPINTCADGRCRQRCFGDQTCLLAGGLCIDGVCQPPQCEMDSDCDDPADECADGRCQPFTTCTGNGDCEAGWVCTESRCRELPACSRDTDCAPDGVCQGGRCQPTGGECTATSSCPDGEECVGGACVPAPECRGNADCTAPAICRAGACQEPATATVARVVIVSPAGLCDPVLDTRSACELTVRPGDSVALSVLTMDAAGRLVAGIPADWAADATAVADVLAGPALDSVLTAGMDTGMAGITATARGRTSATLNVRNLGVATSAARVRVVRAGTGTALRNAVVDIGGVRKTVDDAGVAEFASMEVTAPFTLTVFERDSDYLTFVGLPGPALDVVVPMPLAETGPTAGGLRGTVNLENAPSTGPVSLALAGVSAPSVAGLSFARLLGETFNVELNLPVVGAQNIPLPGGIIASADVPVLGTQQIKTTFDALGTGGRRIAWTFGGRLPFAVVQGLVGLQGPVGALFALAPYFESLTHGLQTGFLLSDLPYVVDGEVEFDGTADVDNDGNSMELVPDYFAFPQAPLTVRQEQTLRAQVRVAGVQQTVMGGQVLLVAGARVPGHGFVPLGMTSAAGESGAVARVMKMAPRYGGLEAGDYAVAAFAFGAEGTLALRTRAYETLPVDADLGTLLAIPTGASYARGQREVTFGGLTDSDVHRVVLSGDTGRWRTWFAGGAGMQRVTLPAVPTGMADHARDGVSVEGIQVGAALHVDGATQLQSLIERGAAGLMRVADEAEGIGRGTVQTR